MIAQATGPQTHFADWREAEPHRARIGTPKGQTADAVETLR